jgi:hypothetical protein
VDSNADTKESPLGSDRLPHFSFSLQRLLLAFAAYALALGAYSYSGREYVAYGLIPGTTMALVVLLFRKQDFALLLIVGIGAIVGGWPCGGIFAAGAKRVSEIADKSFTGIVIDAFIGGLFAGWIYRNQQAKT